MSKINYTDVFLRSIKSIDHSDVVENIGMIKDCITDYFGVLFAGAKLCPADIPVVDNGPYRNALKLGIYSHMAELDDGHRIAMVHAGSTVISAMISAADKYSLGPSDFLLGVVTGYEAALRLSCAIQPSHKKRGFHVTGTAGCAGTAVGIGIALGMSDKELKSVLSSACCCAGGLLEVCESGSQLKPFNSGKSSLSALLAVDMSLTGFSGPDDILGGKRGFFKAMTDELHPEYLERKADEPLMMSRLYRKLYAACRYCHAPLEAVLTVKSEKALGISDIEKIDIETFDLAIPGHDHACADSPQSAKMSIPFSIALAMKTGSAMISDYTEENVHDKQIIELANKITIRSNKELSDLVPDKRGAIVHVYTKAGEEFSEKVDNPKGEPEVPLTSGEIEAKYMDLSCFSGMSQSEADKFLYSIKSIDETAEYERLIERAITL